MTVKNKVLLLLIAVFISVCIGASAQEETTMPKHQLPEGFCYVHEVIDDVILDIRYAGNHNFVGEPIDGYNAPYAIMTTKAAEKLKEAADDFRAMGYRIKIFDAYRPQSAVEHFMRWAKDKSATGMQEEFYPEFSNKTLLVDQGYIARNSSHMRGSAIDLTLTDMEGNELDMGTCFDYFGKKAWHSYAGVTEEQAKNRKLLRRVMEENGFQYFYKEWWHYRYINEPFRDQKFNFPVE